MYDNNNHLAGIVQVAVSDLRYQMIRCKTCAPHPRIPRRDPTFANRADGSATKATTRWASAIDKIASTQRFIALSTIAVKLAQMG